MGFRKKRTSYLRPGRSIWSDYAKKRGSCNFALSVQNLVIALLGAENAVSEKTEFAVATGTVHLVGMGEKTWDVKNRVFRPWESSASANHRKASVLAGRGRWEKATHRKVVDIGWL